MNIHNSWLEEICNLDNFKELFGRHINNIKKSKYADVNLRM